MKLTCIKKIDTYLYSITIAIIQSNNRQHYSIILMASWIYSWDNNFYRLLCVVQHCSMILSYECVGAIICNIYVYGIYVSTFYMRALDILKVIKPKCYLSEIKFATGTDKETWDTKREILDGLESIGHYDDVIMGTMAPQITSLTIVYSTVYSDADQRKYQSSASLAFVWRPVNSPRKWPVTRKMIPFDDVIMNKFI